MGKLSDRMQVICSLVPGEARPADIGTDHGYVAIQLAKDNPDRTVYALDLRKEPLRKAVENARLAGVSGRMIFRQSDGFSALNPGETDLAVLTGIGGKLMIRILENGKKILQTGYQLVLSPQSEVREVRKYLRTHGMKTDQEVALWDSGKYYTVMHCCCQRREDGSDGESETTSGEMLYDRYGRILLERKDPVLKQYLEKEQTSIQKLMAELKSRGVPEDSDRMRELSRQLALNEQAAEFVKA